MGLSFVSVSTRVRKKFCYVAQDGLPNDCRCDATPQLSAVRADPDEEPSAAGPLAKVYEHVMRVLLHVRP